MAQEGAVGCGGADVGVDALFGTALHDEAVHVVVLAGGYERQVVEVGKLEMRPARQGVVGRDVEPYAHAPHACEVERAQKRRVRADDADV